MNKPPVDTHFAAPAEAAPGEPPETTAPALTALQQVRARGPIRGRVALLGPAFVACVAYVDPGNFATNFQGGAKFGYLLIWVIVMANAMAMLIQYLSAKAGMVTGKNLPELCRQMFPRRASFALWGQAELVAMATDVAEFVGAAVGLNLVFNVPLFVAGLITAVIAFVILALQERGYRRFELAIMALIGFVFLGFAYDFFAVGHQSASGFGNGLIPGFKGSQSVLLAVGIIGATVMPHVVYLHSALLQRRVEPTSNDEKSQLLRFIKVDVGIGLGMAGVINLSMLCIAAALFYRTGRTDVTTIELVHGGLGSLVGGGAALAFAIALMASGISSSSVGTYAGQVVMQGFIQRKIPLFVRRAITMTPSLVILAIGLSADQALVFSQVVLSFGIPFALVPLIMATRRRDIMGDFVNHSVTTASASVIALVIIGLNVFLLQQTLLG